MTKIDIILKDLNYISNHIRSSLFDAYNQGRLDGYDKGRADGIEELVDAVCCHSAFTTMQKDAIRVYAEQLKEHKIVTLRR